MNAFIQKRDELIAKLQGVMADYYYTESDLEGVINELKELKPTVKRLEWKEEKGYLIVYIYSDELYYSIDLKRMYVWLGTSRYYVELWSQHLENSYDKTGTESPLEYCKRICQEHYNNFILGQLE